MLNNGENIRPETRGGKKMIHSQRQSLNTIEKPSGVLAKQEVMQRL